MTRNNEPSYRKKGLSVFLTVIMVLSVLAMSAAFATPAVASSHTGLNTDDTTLMDGHQVNVSDGDQEQKIALNVTVADNQSQEFEIRLGPSLDNGIDVTDAEVDDWGDFNETESELDFTAGDDHVTIDVDAWDATEGDITDTVIVDLTVNADDSDIHDRTIRHDITKVEDNSPIKNVRYRVTDPSETRLAVESDNELRALVDGPHDPDEVWQGETLTAVADVSGLNTHIEVQDDDGNVVVNKSTNPGDVRNIDTGQLDAGDYNITFLQSGEEFEFTVLPLDLQVDADDTDYGELIEADITSQDDDESDITAELIDEDGDTIQTIEDNLDGEGEADVRFDYQDPDDYTVKVTHEPSQVTATDETAVHLDLEVSAGDVITNADIDFDVTSVDTLDDSEIEIELQDEDGVTVTSYAPSWNLPTLDDGNYSSTFPGQDDGEYSVNVTHVPTGETASDTLTVDEAIGDVEFGEVEDQAEGDIVSIPLHFDDSEDYLAGDVRIWINESDYNAELALDLSDFTGDSLTIEFNTYYAGEGNDAFDVAHPDASVHVIDETDIDRDDDFRLNPAGYTLGLFDDAGAFNDRIDSETFSVTERHTGDATVHVAPTQWEDAQNFSKTDAEVMSDMLDNSTELDEVAEGDYLIVEQEVSGIFGATGLDEQSLSAGWAFSPAADALDDAGINIQFENLESPAYQHPASFNQSDDPDNQFMWVHGNQSEQKVYSVIYVTGDLLTTGDPLDEGDMKEWDYTFEVTEDSAYVDEDEEETASAQYSVHPRQLELGLVEEPYQVTPTEDAEIRGTSTLAPGTNLTVSVDKPGFFFDQDRTVQVELNDEGDLVWAYTANYSDQEVGDEFDIDVEETYWTTIWSDQAASDSADGVFDEVPEWETLTDAEQMRAILDELKAILDVDDDDDIVDAVEELEADLANAEETIADLEADLADAEGDLADAEDEISDLEADLTEVSTALEEAQDTIEAWQEAAGADTPDDLRDRIDDLNDEISGLEGDISDLEDEVADLEDQISDWQDETGADSPDDYEPPEPADDDQPAFGPLAALIAILAGGALVAKRRFA